VDKTQRAFFNSITKWKHDTAEIARQLVTSVALLCLDHLPVMHVLSGAIHSSLALEAYRGLIGVSIARGEGKFVLLQPAF